MGVGLGVVVGGGGGPGLFVGRWLLSFIGGGGIIEERDWACAKLLPCTASVVDR